MMPLVSSNFSCMLSVGRIMRVVQHCQWTSIGIWDYHFIVDGGNRHWEGGQTKARIIPSHCTMGENGWTRLYPVLTVHSSHCTMGGDVSVFGALMFSWAIWGTPAVQGNITNTQMSSSPRSKSCSNGTVISSDLKNPKKQVVHAAQSIMLSGCLQCHSHT